MDDEVGVRILHRATEIDEQHQFLGTGHLHTLAVLRDGKTLDVLERQIWLPVRCDAAVEQRHDRRMGEPRQDLTFQPEALQHLGRTDSRPHQFDGHPLFKFVVGPLGEVDIAHSTGADSSLQPVGAGHGP